MGVAKIERSRKGKAAAAISAAPRENEPTKEEVRAAWSKIRRAAALGLSVFLSSVLYNGATAAQAPRNLPRAGRSTRFAGARQSQCAAHKASVTNSGRASDLEGTYGGERHSPYHGRLTFESTNEWTRADAHMHRTYGMCGTQNFRMRMALVRVQSDDRLSFVCAAEDSPAAHLDGCSETRASIPTEADELRQRDCGCDKVMTHVMPEPPSTAGRLDWRASVRVALVAPKVQAQPLGNGRCLNHLKSSLLHLAVQKEGMAGESWAPAESC
ncbi:hypothetical protein T492DRAFT_1150878 [Pavlovales sp. CCMP2436]|nr:hypothetical protein T492DRAFT_1150878 [Pavlovales sp. CCMP2436]